MPPLCERKVTMDPFENYDVVQELAQGKRAPVDKSTYKLDYDSGMALSVREALKDVPKPYAVGGRVVRQYGLFDTKSIDLWMEFLGKTKDEAERAELKQLLGRGQIPVDALMEVAKPAPFGKGTETVFDNTVRNAFEIPGDVFPTDLFPRDFPEEDTIRDEIEAAMKPKGAEWFYKLYKMHLYGPGGKFQAHVDTLHNSHHVATLVIALPVDHDGGSLVVKHLGKTTTYNLANTDPNVAKYCAFFTDCEHVVEEVISGWRVVTQYDIYEISSSATNNNSKKRSLDQAIGSWVYQSKITMPRLVSVAGAFPQAEAAVDLYLSAKAPGDRVAILFNHLYALPSLQAATPVLKGADSVLYEMFSSDKWIRKLQGVVLTSKTNYDGEWKGVSVAPVSMDDFDENVTSIALRDGTTHLILGWDSAPGKRLSSEHYVEYTGNEAALGHLAYWACCIILEKAESTLGRW